MKKQKNKKISEDKKEKTNSRKNNKKDVILEKDVSNVLSAKFLISLISICSLFVVILFIGFVLHYRFDTETIEDNKSGGNIRLVYTTEDANITLPNTAPITDSIGVLSIYNFDFAVETNLKEASSVEYELSISLNDDYNTLSNDDIKVYLEKENSGTYAKFFGPSVFKPLSSESLLGTKKGDMVIAEVKKIKSGVDNYRLRVWQSDKSTASGVISIDVKLNGKAK